MNGCHTHMCARARVCARCVHASASATLRVRVHLHVAAAWCVALGYCWAQCACRANRAGTVRLWPGCVCRGRPFHVAAGGWCLVAHRSRENGPGHHLPSLDTLGAPWHPRRHLVAGDPQDGARLARWSRERTDGAGGRKGVCVEGGWSMCGLWSMLHRSRQGAVAAWGLAAASRGMLRGPQGKRQGWGPRG